jgi:hypothetical protein
MYARALQEAEARLVELHHEELHRIALSAVALGGSLTATVVYPPLAFPLLVGGLAIWILGIGAVWRHWDLVDRLADDEDSYLIPEIRAYAARDAGMNRRLGHAALIRSWTRHPELAADTRIAEFAEQLEELAGELEHADLELDPGCALACRRLLTDPMVSPLLNRALPHEDVGSFVVRIRAGFRHRAQRR